MLVCSSGNCIVYGKCKCIRHRGGCRGLNIKSAWRCPLPVSFTQNPKTSTNIQVRKREFCINSVQVKFSTNVNPFLEDRLGLKRVKKRQLFEQSPLFFGRRALAQSSMCVSPPDKRGRVRKSRKRIKLCK